jgi:hypothetical protein
MQTHVSTCAIVATTVGAKSSHPTDLSLLAIVVISTGMPWRGTVRAKLCILTCWAKRPVIKLDLLGEQNLYV